MFPPCLFNLYAEYIIWNARVENSQAGNKIARRNTNNLRYTEELKSLLKKVEEESEKLA